MNRALNFSAPLKKGLFWLSICFFIFSFSPNTERHHAKLPSDLLKPVNDKVCHAIMLDFLHPIDFNNSLATAEIQEIDPGIGKSKKSCLTQDGWCKGENMVQNSLWYYFVAPENQRVNIEALGGNLQLAVYQIIDCHNFDSFEEVAANDNSKVATSAYIENLEVKAGKKYYIQVDGYNGAKVYGGRLILQPGTPLSIPPDPCIGKFQHTTIGQTGTFPGISNFDLCKGIFDISSSTAPINEFKDGLQFSYTELCGDGEIIVKMGNITGKGFAGLSIRESLDPEAKMISLYRQSFNYNVYREARLKEGHEVK